MVWSVGVVCVSSVVLHGRGVNSNAAYKVGYYMVCYNCVVNKCLFSYECLDTFCIISF